MNLMKMKLVMNKITSIFLMCLVAFCLASCTSSHPIDTSKVEADFLDISIQSTTPKINSKDIYLYVVNKTNDCVVFPYDYGLEIYLKVNEDWVKTNNLVEYANTKSIPLTSFSGIEPDAIIFIRPDYSNISDQPTDIKIILNAYLCNNGKPSLNLSKDYIEIPLEQLDLR